MPATNQSCYLVPLPRAELLVGKPVPYDVFDAEHNLLLKKGVVVISDNQVSALADRGFYRERLRQQARELTPEQVRESVYLEERPRQVTSTTQPKVEGLPLGPGDALHLQPAGDDKTRYVVPVIGVMHQKSLLVAAPTASGRLIPVHDGQPFLARGFSGKTACAFSTRILKAYLQPYPYVHLEFPQTMQTVKVRSDLRAEVDLIATVHDAQTSTRLGACRILDISVKGARVVTPACLGVAGDVVSLSFKVELGSMEEYITVAATIRSVLPGEYGGRPMQAYGVKLADLNASQRLLLTAVIYQKITSL